jgi:hypothetical protein
MTLIERLTEDARDGIFSTVDGREAAFVGVVRAIDARIAEEALLGVLRALHASPVSQRTLNAHLLDHVRSIESERRGSGERRVSCPDGRAVVVWWF